jgi:hypothetical protein
MCEWAFTRLSPAKIDAAEKNGIVFVCLSVWGVPESLGIFVSSP